MPGQSNRHILIVEDEPLVRWSLATCLRRQDYEVVELESGEDALAHVAANDVDLIVLDVTLAGMTGLEVLETLRNGRHASLPVIVITAFEDVELTASCRQLCVYKIMNKPFTLEQFATTVAAALAGMNRDG